MRLFAAIVPPDAVLDSLEAVLAPVAHHAMRDPAVRWNDRSLWHITLAFYGEDDLGERTEWLRARIRQCCQAPRLGIEGAGTFPGVLWAGLAGELESLTALAEAVRGRAPERRPYHPHVTLARWKRRKPPRSVGAVTGRLAAYRGPTWRADEVVLMRSELTERGPRYSPQDRFGLP